MMKKTNHLGKSIDIIDKTNGLFKVDLNKSSNLFEPLVKDSPCIISGNFTPVKLGRYSLVATLTFKEGRPSSVSTAITQAIAVTVVGKNSIPLPTKMGLNTSAKVEYIFKNDSSNVLDATHIRLSVDDLQLIKMYREKIGDPSSKTQVDQTDFSGDGILNAGEILTLSGDFVAKNVGKNKGPTIRFNYAEGEEIVFINTTHGTEVVEVEVIAAVKPDLPEHMKINQTTEVSFIFTNQHAEISASDVSITISEVTV